KVKMALDRLLVGKTVMTIAHRLSTIKNYDKIVFIEDGKIIEIGTYQELIDKRNKFYNFVNHHISVKEVII
ncbi:ABC transporter ATP-binding protein, partial [Bacillus thuringiensis]|nr:ABC transporter ATP-binding protein [Bacillus thuringiensis]